MKYHLSEKEMTNNPFEDSVYHLVLHKLDFKVQNNIDNTTKSYMTYHLRKTLEEQMKDRLRTEITMRCVDRIWLGMDH